MWIKKHWAGASGVIFIVLSGLLKLVGWAGDVDFLLAQWQNPGWVSNVLTALLSPPGWGSLLLPAVGLMLIGFDINLSMNKRFKADLLLRRKDEVIAKCDQWAAALEQTRTDFLVGAITKADGELIVNKIGAERKQLMLIWGDRLFEYACEFSTDGDRYAAWALKNTACQHPNMLELGWVSINHSTELATVEMSKKIIVRVIDRYLSHAAIGV